MCVCVCVCVCVFGVGESGRQMIGIRGCDNVFLGFGRESWAGKQGQTLGLRTLGSKVGVKEDQDPQAQQGFPSKVLRFVS